MLNFFIFLISVAVLMGTVYFPFPVYEIIVLMALVVLAVWRYYVYSQTRLSADQRLELLLEAQLLQKKR